MLDTALQLAAAGFKIFPAHPETRKPMVMWGTEATTDEMTIRAWWSERPDAMPSIALSERQLVVDVDPRNGGDATLDRWLEAEPELRDVFASVPRVQTARGGWHFYFSVPEGLSIKNGEWTKYGKGIDIKTAGGFVIAPGAVRADGLRYGALIPGNAVDVPASVVADRRRDQKADTSPQVPVIWSAGESLEEAMVPGLVALFAPRLAVKGSRHNVARALGGALALAGWTDEGIESLVRALPSDAPGDRARDAVGAANRAREGLETPQWGALERAGYAPGIVAAARTMATGGRFDALAAEAAAKWAAQNPAAVALASAAGETEADPWGAFGIDDYRKPLPKIPWLCEGLNIAPGPPNLIAGYGGIGKSMLAQAFVVCVATGRSMFGTLMVRKGKVLHLDFEQGRLECEMRYQRLAADMFRAEADTHGILRGVLDVSSPPPVSLDTPGIEEALIFKCAGYDLCVIDSLRAACPTLDENDSRIRGPLDMLWRVSEKTGCTFIVIHHARKDNKNNGGTGNQNMRGNSAINDAARTVIMCEAFKDPELSGFNIACGKVRAGKKFSPMSVQLDDTDLERVPFQGLRFTVIDGDAHAAALEVQEKENLADAICKIVEAAPGGTFRGGLRRLYAELDRFPERKIRRVVSVLVGTGRLFEDKGNIFRVVK